MSASFVIGTSLFLICVFGGILYSKNIDDKLAFFKAMRELNMEFVSSIKFRRDDLLVILCKDYGNENLSSILREKTANVRSGKEVTLRFPPYINEKEKYQISNYFIKIGKYDCETSLTVLQNYDEYFNSTIKKLTEEKSQKGVLYKKLGIIIGLIAFIIVI